jgi:hypothetical protein
VPNLALIALGDSHHSQGGMKFATQISPLLNFLEIFWYKYKFLTAVMKPVSKRSLFYLVNALIIELEKLDTNVRYSLKKS